MNQKQAKDLLEGEFGFKPVKNFKFKPFLSLKSEVNLKICDCFILPQPGALDSLILIVKYDHVLLATQRSLPSIDTSYYFYGILNGLEDMGHIVIRPETTRDKINELAYSIEIDYEDSPEFSKKFYVTAENPSQAYTKLNFKIREFLALHPECELEYIENQCLFRINRTSISEKTLRDLLHLMGEYVKILH